MSTSKNQSELMLEAARADATAILLDRRLFRLDTKAYKRFAAALDKTPADNPRLRRLLTSRACWEQ